MISDFRNAQLHALKILVDEHMVELNEKPYGIVHMLMSHYRDAYEYAETELDSNKMFNYSISKVIQMIDELLNTNKYSNCPKRYHEILINNTKRCI